MILPNRKKTTIYYWYFFLLLFSNFAAPQIGRKEQRKKNHTHVYLSKTIKQNGERENINNNNN